MPFVPSPPASWTQPDRHPYVTHNTPRSQTPNAARVTAAAAAQDARRVFSETTHGTTPTPGTTTSAWDVSWTTNWGSAWG